MRTCLLVLALCWLSSLAGCSGASRQEGGPEVRVELAIEPSPPKVGPATVLLTWTGADGLPLRGATVKLEGNMNHAGMEPVFADAKEIEPGKYQADMKFTMGGDWFLLVSATLGDGRKVSKKIDVPGVRSRP